jgi:hypothetical protein
VSNLNMQVTADPGSHLDKVCMELVRTATIIGICVECGFNGTKLIAKPNDNPFHLARAFETRKEGDRYIFSYMGIHE